MRPLVTLRGRLMASMLAILVLALAGSAALDALEGRHRAGTPVALPPSPGGLDAEPYQDALVLAGFTVPALLIVWLVSSWSLRPLARASREAQSIGPRDSAARISRAGLPAEIAPLVDAVNGALDRMAAAFEAERRFTENAAHELRTPLAVLGLRLQRARQAGASPDWPAIEHDLAHMNRLVAQMLHLARQENAGRAAPAARPAVNLSRVAREACAMVLPLTEAQGRALAIDLPASLMVRGDAADLRDALCAVLENAVVHGAGMIDVTGEAADLAIVTIGDQGPGIATAMQEAMFERFRKGAHSAGSGLGLAIVREVLRNHGGDVTFLPGRCCRVELRLPKAP